MNISKHFTKSGAGDMTQVSAGHGVDFITKTVRVTLHRADNHMAHISMSPAEAREMANQLLKDASQIDGKATGLLFDV